jgi:hypothetical protein
MATYTFDQIGVMARCVWRSRAAMLNALLGPVVGSIGGAEWTGHSVSGGKRSPRKASSSDRNHRVFNQSEMKTPEAKDAGLLRALSGAGIGIRSG